MTDSLEMIWKEAAMAYWDYCPRICREGLRKTTKILSEVISVVAET
jgi:hypothetical protein